MLTIRVPNLSIIDTMVTSPIRSPVPLPLDLDPTPYRIRAAQVKDLQQLAEVLASSFYPPLGWRRYLYPVLRFSIYEDIKQRLQAKHQYYKCLTAIIHDNGRHRHDLVVGTVEMSHRRYSWRVFNQPQQIYLSNLAVREGYRRRGAARQLLRASEQQALDWGFREIYLHVMSDNNRARQLYQHMGYRVQRVETTLLSLLNVQPQRILLKKVLPSHTTSSSINPKSPQTSVS